MKGITPIVILLLLTVISISLAAGYLVWSQRFADTLGAQGQESIEQAGQRFYSIPRIDSVSDQKVYVRNAGTREMSASGLAFYIDGTPVNSTANFASLQPSSTDYVTITSLWFHGSGSHSLRVTSGVESDTVPIEIELADGRVLDLRFEEGSGTTASDSSGNGNMGTLKDVTGSCGGTACPSWVDGKIGKSLRFDGVGDYVIISQVLTGNSPFTLEVWANPDDLTTPWKTIAGETCSGFDLVINGGTATFGRNCGSGNGFYNGGSVLASRWTHFVMFFDGTTLNMYKDGVLTTGGPSVYTHATLYLGTYNGATEFFKGAIDEVRIYNRVLMPDQLYVMRLA